MQGLNTLIKNEVAPLVQNLVPATHVIDGCMLGRHPIGIVVLAPHEQEPVYQDGFGQPSPDYSTDALISNALYWAYRAQESGLPSSTMFHDSGWWLESADLQTALPAYAVCENGLVVSVACVAEWFDCEALAWTILTWIQAAARRHRQETRGGRFAVGPFNVIG